MLARVLHREIVVPSPRAGVAAMGASYYTERQGVRLMGTHGYISRSDTVDVGYARFSDDNGRTWTAPVERPTKFEAGGGTGRRHFRGGYVDPQTGRFLFLWTEGVLPTDHPLEGLRRWTLHCSISEDGGRSERFSGQIIAEGADYDAVHHLPGVTVGKNCVMMGDLGMRPLTRSDGAILVPVQTSPVGPDGDYWNPTGALTYLDAMLLIGRWKPDGSLAWTVSERVKGDPERTTRGVFESTIAEIDGGRILMVMRGSNERRVEQPGRKWRSVSEDGGETWSPPEPWCYEDGEAFFSPSSCSQLVPYADGRLFWFGNISPSNPQGNAPRYPFVMGEVDRRSGHLMRGTVTLIDDRQEGEMPQMTLSNFLVREDRETGHLLLHMSRLFARRYQNGKEIDWTADALLYRLCL